MALTQQEQNFVGRVLQLRSQMLDLYEEANRQVDLWRTKGWYYDEQNPAETAISDADLAGLPTYSHLTANALSNLVGTLNAYIDLLDADGRTRYKMLNMAQE